MRTPGDIQAFVQCAYEYVQEEGFDEVRRAFNEDERWRSSQFYIFVDEVTSMTEMARAFVYPPTPQKKGNRGNCLSTPTATTTSKNCIAS